MKKLLVLFVALFFCGAVYAGSPSALSVRGGKLVDSAGESVVLHGVSMGWHSSWPRFYNPEAVREVADVWGADVVRAAIGVHPREKGYMADPAGSWKCLEAVVEGAVERGIYVIVDWHSHAIETEAAVEFFRKVAARWGDKPNVIYEIFNEPVNDSWEQVKEYSVRVIEAIRQTDPDNIILVGSPHWCQDIHLVAADPIAGYDNLMYTMHFYAATHKDELRTRTEDAIKSGLPVFVSECAAMEATGDGPLDYESWGKWEKMMADHDTSWVTWSLSEKDESCSMIRDGAVPATGHWTDGDLKEWGKFVRNRLQSMKKFDEIGDGLRLNFFGHGSVGFEFGGKYFYVDPVSDYADYGRLPKADYIFVTHEHGDHLDAKAIEALTKPQTVIYLNGTARETLGRGEVLEWGESITVIDSVFWDGKDEQGRETGGFEQRNTFSVEAVPAYNVSPAQLNFHPRARKHNGYVFTFDGTRIYVAGDTEPVPEMAALKGVDIAFLPVNQPYTMTEEQAVAAIETIEPKIFYPYHFGGTDHRTDIGKLQDLLSGSGIEVRVRPLE